MVDSQKPLYRSIWGFAMMEACFWSSDKITRATAVLVFVRVAEEQPAYQT